MKKIIFLTSAIILSGCQSQTIEATKPMEKPQIVGGDSDAHGCKASAGYTWSKTRATCVRVWEVGTRLNSFGNGNKPSEYIIIRNGNNGPIELFGPNINGIVLKGKKPKWKDVQGNYTINIENISTQPLANSRMNMLILCKVNNDLTETGLAFIYLD